MALSDFILNGVTQIEDTLGNPTFTYKGESFACIPNTLKETVKGGNKELFIASSDFRLTVRLNQFSSGIYPAVNDYITYMDRKLLIKEIYKPVHNQYWVYVTAQPEV